MPSAASALEMSWELISRSQRAGTHSSRETKQNKNQTMQIQQASKQSSQHIESQHGHKDMPLAAKCQKTCRQGAGGMMRADAHGRETNNSRTALCAPLLGTGRELRNEPSWGESECLLSTTSPRRTFPRRRRARAADRSAFLSAPENERCRRCLG